MDSHGARALARDLVAGIEPRWRHIQAVGQRAESLAARHSAIDEELVVAAWLHDVGYAPKIRFSGQHSIDGAAFLLANDCSPQVVRLVAHHTGAGAEAAERGLTQRIGAFPQPDSAKLDILTLIDLSVGPDGSSLLDSKRIAEILTRYSEHDPVYRAVTRSQKALLAASARAKRLLGLPDDWPVATC